MSAATADVLDLVEEEVPCPATGCPELTICEPCGLLLCTEHSADLPACVDGHGQIHHWDCRDECTSCAAAMAEDAHGDRAGGWDR